MSRPNYIAANWKMHGSRESNQTLLEALKSELETRENTKVLIAAPFVYLEQLNRILSNAGISFGAQNVSEFESGAYTGEVSASMLADLGCDFCIVGHSERRTLFNESDAQIASKIERLLAFDIQPLLCVGETLEQREAGITEKIVEQQLSEVVEVIGAEGLGKIILAYEPVWAIGTGKTASPEQAQAVHGFLRSCLAKVSGELANETAILYGGSVKESNAGDLFSQEDIDGGLIGGASLKADSFIEICKVI